MKTAYIDCTGCEQRWMDTERVQTFLEKNGYLIVDNPSDGDVSILVSCAVDEDSEIRSIKRLNEIDAAKRQNCRLIVGGCLPSISPNKLEHLGLGPFFSPRNLDVLEDILEEKSVRMRDIPDPNLTHIDRTVVSPTVSANIRQEYDEAKRGFKIRVNHGCLLSCSYCVIKKATGQLESVPLNEILAAFESALEKGEPTIMLMGGDTGAYGRDAGFDLAALLRRLLSYEGQYKIFIHDFNINYLLRSFSDFADVFQTSFGRIRAICLPIQSGSDELLRRMRRPYRRSDVLRSLHWIKENASDIGLGTHVIVGFPGETEADFRLTVDLLEKINFDFITCFKYSEHSNASSATLPNKVMREVIDRRMANIKDIFGARATMLG